jgi:hypothetical protein
MSLFTVYSHTCKACGHLFTLDVVGSVNATGRPDLRAAILDETFQEYTCASCGETARMEPSFTYVDAERGQWIMALPARDMTRYRTREAATADLFDRSYGSQAPAAAERVGDTMAVRLTFGWPAVREKLYLREVGLDDVVVEQVKLDLYRRLPGAPADAGVEVRLVEFAEGRMRFDWLEAENESLVSSLTIDLELYDAIAADSAGWAEIRAVLTDGTFVDMQKTMYDGQADEAALPAA